MNEVESLALAGLLHDTGKFGQRAKIDIQKDSYDFQSYCPMKFGEYWTHQHSAYTADFLKSIVGKQGEFSFIDPKVSDESFENISAKHHKPTTAKEWIVAMADRVASGFEREEFFDTYNNSDDRESQDKKLKFYEIPLESVFDKKRIFELEKFDTQSIYSKEFKKLSQEKYKKLYDEFEQDVVLLKKKPKSNFVSGLDYLLKKYTSYIPSSTYGTKANIPLYDHLKTTASFASALAKYHENDMNLESIKDYDTKKFLLIAGDFFGIQQFIFDDLPTSKASKILRGKSAFIQIFIKVIAIDICNKLGLSKLSIVSDNAGKFEILAPNAAQTKESLKIIQKELNSWFLENTFGQSGIGISFVEVSPRDFTESKFQALRDTLAKQIELTKYKKFDLTTQNSIFDVETKDNAHLCKTCNKRFKNNTNNDKSCDYCQTFITLGEQLAKASFINITTKKTDIPLYGEYFVEFKSYIDAGSEIVFDISNDEEFKGYAKWALKSYVQTNDDKSIVDFETLEERARKDEVGAKALMSLKGDVDNMGDFLKKGNINSFAKFNFISRLIDYFFSVKVSKMMDGKNVYTIFAGGDDFFIIGSWDEIIILAREIREEFMKFVSGSTLSLSVGMVMFKHSKPINFIAHLSEEALEDSKKLEGKDGITLFKESVKWNKYLDGSRFIEELEKTNPNTAFTYLLLDFIEMSKKVKYDGDIASTIWKSKLNYSFTRNMDKGQQSFLAIIDKMIDKHPKEAKMKVSEFIYKRRD